MQKNWKRIVFSNRKSFFVIRHPFCTKLVFLKCIGLNRIKRKLCDTKMENWIFEWKNLFCNWIFSGGDRGLSTIPHANIWIIKNILTVVLLGIIVNFIIQRHNLWASLLVIDFFCYSRFTQYKWMKIFRIWRIFRDLQ